LQKFSKGPPVGEARTPDPDIFFQSKIFHLMLHLAFVPVAWSFGFIGLDATDVVRIAKHE